jgi:hypothetical protein
MGSHAGGNEHRRRPVAHVMASVAADGRSAFVRAFFVTFLVTIAFLPWHQVGPQRVVVSLDAVKRPPVVVAMELDAPPAPGLLGRLADVLAPAFGPAVIVPPAHPDAQPWPRGMVIHPPPFKDDMVTAMPNALDTMLSGLLAPWRAIAS